MKSVFLKREHDRHDLGLFVAALLVGSLGIVLLKAFGIAQIWVTAFPCVILTVYFVYVCWTKRYQLRGDRAGDSVYYLGFLYTLVSLGVSLAQFVFEGLAPREIVGNLGIALFTTIFGLAGRVVLTQLREDPVEMEESARMALAEATSMVRAELAQMVVDVNTFRRTMVQSLTEGSEELTRETNKTLSENVKLFTTSAQSMVERIETTFSEFGDNAKRMNKASAGTISSLEKLISRIEAIDTPQSLVSDLFQPLAQQVEKTIDALNAKAAEQTAAVERLRSALDSTLTRASQTMSSMDRVANASETIAAETSRSASQVAASVESIQSISEAMIASLNQATEAHTRSSTGLIDAAERSLASLTGTIGAILDEFAASQVQTGDALAGKLESAVGSVEAAVGSLKKSAGDIEIRAAQSGEEAIKLLTKQLDQVQRALADALSRHETSMERLAESHIAVLTEKLEAIATRPLPDGTEPSPEASPANGWEEPHLDGARMNGTATVPIGS